MLVIRRLGHSAVWLAALAGVAVASSALCQEATIDLVDESLTDDFAIVLGTLGRSTAVTADKAISVHELVQSTCPGATDNFILALRAANKKDELSLDYMLTAGEILQFPPCPPVPTAKLKELEVPSGGTAWEFCKRYAGMGAACYFPKGATVSVESFASVKDNIYPPPITDLPDTYSWPLAGDAQKNSDRPPPDSDPILVSFDTVSADPASAKPPSIGIDKFVYVAKNSQYTYDDKLSYPDIIKALNPTIASWDAIDAGTVLLAPADPITEFSFPLKPDVDSKAVVSALEPFAKGEVRSNSRSDMFFSVKTTACVASPTLFSLENEDKILRIVAENIF